MPEKIRLVVTSRTVHPGREFLPGEVLVEGVAPDGVTLAQVNRLIGMGRARALNFDSAAKVQAPPLRTQEPPPVSTRGAPDPLAGKSAAEVRSELEQARKADEAKKDEAAKPKASRSKSRK